MTPEEYITLGGYIIMGATVIAYWLFIDWFNNRKGGK